MKYLRPTLSADHLPIRISSSPHLQRTVRTLSILALLCTLLLPLTTKQPAQAATTAAATPTFPGPVRGVPSTQTPAAKDFFFYCNAAVNDQAGQIGSTAIPAGTAIEASTGCGQALLLVDVPESGRFQARFGVAADATSTAPAKVRVQTLGHSGYPLDVIDFTTTKASGPTTIDVSVTGAVALTLDFSSSPKTFVYAVYLSGSARTLSAPAATGEATAAGATPLSLAHATYDCNAEAATTPVSVSRVSIPAASAATAVACGKITVSLPSNTQGTLVLRYGAADDTAHRFPPNLLSVRVLDAQGHLLRKAIAVSVTGGGLQPLWVGVNGGSTITMKVDGNTVNKIVVTGLGILAATLPTYAPPNHVSFGTPGTSIPVDVGALVSTCNASVGTIDSSVAHTPVLANTYISATGCGSTELVLTGAHGGFHARFGVPDDARSTSSSVQVVVFDRTSHPLFRGAFHASRGTPGVSIDVSIERASIVSFSFTGDSALYNLTLNGTATIYDRLYPPTDPPVTTPGGVPINPRDFSVSCNAEVATQDVLLVHEAALEFWTLSGLDCGSALLTLSGSHYPAHQFSARIGIPLSDQKSLISQLQLNVLDATGKVIRHITFTARQGYGPQPIGISLAGGAKLQLQWLRDGLTVFAMTAS